MCDFNAAELFCQNTWFWAWLTIKKHDFYVHNDVVTATTSRGQCPELITQTLTL